MTDTERKKIIDSRIVLLEKRMEDRYGTPLYISGKKCFKAKDTEYFRLARLAWANAIVIEHAYSENEAEKNMFEDGDLFYMDEMTEEEMLNEMIAEIER